ncbi:NucA/NucB deoxyribonuclease domain-containing protein [Streptosporangium saharense]|uniref:NucA/NucB deoxyribonuclease domain-containing protein n=1 Tax=Streptosporangium saharense TaxID=1706840 RepID=UPI00368C832F
MNPLRRLTSAAVCVLTVTALCLGTPALATAQAPTPTSDPKPVLPQKEAQRRALHEAARLGDHSYYDADKVGADGHSSQSLSRLATTLAFPATPPQPDTDDCLSSNDAERKEGRTYNRLLWCQKIEYRARYQTVDTSGNVRYWGTNAIRWNMVAMGSNTQRAIRIFWRPEAGSVRYLDWTDPTVIPSTLPFAVRPECAQGSSYCSTSGSAATNSWAGWNTTTGWSAWDVQGPALANDSSREKITTFDWHLTTDATTPRFPLGGGKTLDLPFRCDSADYFSRFGQSFDRACVFTTVIPHLQYRLSSPKHGAVARHIYDAQLSPDTSYPAEGHRKVIPGRWTNDPDDPALHRVEGSGTIAKANETWKDYACNRNGPYNAVTGLPPRTPQQEADKWQCDEYPFHATAEGASSGTWDFSVRWVPPSQNASAGGSLISYFFDDRILFVNDPFWVQINP